MILNIIQAPDPRLSTPSDPVLTIDQTVKTLAGNMLDTMRRWNGLGLSAVQIGVSLRVIVLSGRTKCPWSILINPAPITMGGDVQEVAEACLSIDNGMTEYLVPRRQLVGIRFVDQLGAEHRFQTNKLLARVLLHELDHLEGKLISDRGVMIRKYEEVQGHG